MNDESEDMSKEVVIAHSKILIQHSHEEAKKTHKNLS